MKVVYARVRSASQDVASQDVASQDVASQEKHLVELRRTGTSAVDRVAE